MSQLNLSFVNDNGKTRTKIGLKQGVNKIHITNRAASVLNVVFSSAVIVKHGGGALPNNTLTLSPGQAEDLKFKDNPAVGTEVGYTATITGAQPEDPIIIID